MTKNIELSEEEKKQKETVQNIAKAISNLSGAVKALLNGPIKTKSLIVLLSWSSGVPQYQVQKILEELGNMDKVHLK